MDHWLGDTKERRPRVTPRHWSHYCVVTERGVERSEMEGKGVGVTGPKTEGSFTVVKPEIESKMKNLQGPFCLRILFLVL